MVDKQDNRKSQDKQKINNRWCTLDSLVSTFPFFMAAFLGGEVMINWLFVKCDSLRQIIYVHDNLWSFMTMAVIKTLTMSNSKDAYLIPHTMFFELLRNHKTKILGRRIGAQFINPNSGVLSPISLSGAKRFLHLLFILESFVCHSKTNTWTER